MSRMNALVRRLIAATIGFSTSAICQFFENILRLLMASKQVLIKLVVFEETLRQFVVLGQ